MLGHGVEIGPIFTPEFQLERAPASGVLTAFNESHDMLILKVNAECHIYFAGLPTVVSVIQ